MADRMAAVGHAIFEGPNIVKIFESEVGVNLLAIFPTAAEAQKVLENVYGNNTGRYKIYKVEIP